MIGPFRLLLRNVTVLKLPICNIAYFRVFQVWFGFCLVKEEIN